MVSLMTFFLYWNFILMIINLWKKCRFSPSTLWIKHIWSLMILSWYITLLTCQFLTHWALGALIMVSIKAWRTFFPKTTGKLRVNHHKLRWKKVHKHSLNEFIPNLSHLSETRWRNDYNDKSLKIIPSNIITTPAGHLCRKTRWRQLPFPVGGHLCHGGFYFIFFLWKDLGVFQPMMIVMNNKQQII